MRERIWTISNGLSLLRLFLVLPIGIALQEETPSARLTVGVLLLAAVATDLLDGWLARKLNEVTTFGKIIDPLADKAAVGVVATMLMLKGIIPLWFYLLVVVRDALIVAGGIYLRSGRTIVLASNTLGKWAVTAVSFYIFCSLFLPDPLRPGTEAMLWVSVAMLLLSFGAYARRFMQVLRNGAQEARRS
jgi:CDP-diacylglycerol--glycerol-3-phosphate 3-phosphatidyltransferase